MSLVPTFMTLLQFYLDCVSQQHTNAIINYLKFKKKIFIHDKLQFKLSFMNSLNVKNSYTKKNSKFSTEANEYHTFNLDSNGGKD